MEPVLRAVGYATVATTPMRPNQAEVDEFIRSKFGGAHIRGAEQLGHGKALKATPGAENYFKGRSKADWGYSGPALLSRYSGINVARLLDGHSRGDYGGCGGPGKGS